MNQPFEIPYNLGEVISHFCALVYKNYHDEEQVQSLFASLSLIIKRNYIHFLALDLGHFFNSVLLTLQALPKDSKEAKEKLQPSLHILHSAFDMVREVVDTMTIEQKF